MISKNIRLVYCAFPWFYLLLSTHLFASSSSNSPCGGSNNLLSLVNRPSFGDNACVAPNKTVILETGYTYQNLTGGGTQQNVPQALYRWGVAESWEVNVLLPSYINQTVSPHIGSTPTQLGVKYEIASRSNWVTSIEGYAILPSGSASFGSQEGGGIINGLFTYNITSSWSLAGMLGVGSLSEPIEDGGARFSSINPDIVLSWSTDKISFYGEVYGQSKTGANEGSGFLMDGGVLYQIKPNIVLDFELGQRLSGDFGFDHLIGAGVSILFS